MELARLGGNFWEDGLDALVGGVPDISEDTLDQEEEEWEKEVLMTLDGLRTVAVDEGYAVYRLNC